MLKLSIIVPAYNAERTIENTLRSILRQNMEDAEVIIINDGSTDATLNIINNVVATVATKMEVKIISQENKGLSETRNIGIRTARGRYWTTVDADDEVVDGGLQALLAAAERDEYPDVIYGNTDVYNIIGGGIQ
jgi:glycosyltransferase involved in cell wall biosynthesis